MRSLFAAIARNKLFHLVSLLVGLPLLATAIQFLLSPIVSTLGLKPSLAVVLILNTIVAAALIAGYVGLVRLVERRRASELSPSAAPVELPSGVLIGVALFAAVIGVLWALGFAMVTPSPHDFAGVTIAISMVSSVNEELMFRGVLFRIVEDSFGTLAALVVSALVFGAVHGANPGATIVTSSFIAIEAGLLLALAYTATGRLWLPIGLHFGWNFAESGIFGSVLSGFSFGGLLHTTTSGPPLVSGGVFGPEGSVVAMIICLVASAAFAIIAVRRGTWRPAGIRLRAA